MLDKPNTGLHRSFKRRLNAPTPRYFPHRQPLTDRQAVTACLPGSRELAKAPSQPLHGNLTLCNYILLVTLLTDFSLLL
jgi:hypothetical protein